MKHITWRFNSEVLQFYAQFDRAHITINEAFGTWSWSIYGGDYKDDNDTTLLAHGKQSDFEGAKADSLQAIERIHPGITDPYHELRKRIEEIASMHPYKQVGNPDSYTDFNQGWTCAIDEVLEVLR